jgi:FtsP/CotA-like multicopper oxidase with cupredoxin domain
VSVWNGNGTKGKVLVALLAVVSGSIVTGVILGTLAFAQDGGEAGGVTEYHLEISATDIDYGGGNVWHAWTFKEAGKPAGSVPGPTLHVTVGETLRVNVRNDLDLVHSFHTHLTDYDQDDDGSQTNTISGVGSGAMIPPGESWTYEFEPTEPGIYYYHCHSADGDLHISQHIHQGLYGAIVVHAEDEDPVREEVLFMGEMGHEIEGDSVPTFIMNGMGLPGGEHALEQAYLDGGFDAVAAQLNVTVPAFEAEVGEEIRMHVVNIGDQIHSFHAHNVTHYSEYALEGRAWPANTLPLVPGAADTLRLTFNKPGIWLFHCHVVNHADAGMIGVFVISDSDPDAPPAEPATPPPRTPDEPEPTATAGAAEAGAVDVMLSEWAVEGGDGGALAESVAAGDVSFNVHNMGTVPHELVVLKTEMPPDALPVENLLVDEDAAGNLAGRTDLIAGGARGELQIGLDPGTYVLLCNVAGHYEQGMFAPLVVR